MDTPDLTPDVSPNLSPESSHYFFCSSDSNGDTSTSHGSFKMLPEAMSSKLTTGKSFWETKNHPSLHISCASCYTKLIVWLSISLNEDRYPIEAWDFNAFCQQCGSGNKGKAPSLKSPKEREAARKKQEKLDAFHELRKNWICCGGFQFLEPNTCGKHNNWLTNKCPKCTHCCCSECKNWPGPSNVIEYTPRQPGPGYIRRAQPVVAHAVVPPAPVAVPIAPLIIPAIPVAPVDPGQQDPNEDDEEVGGEELEQQNLP